MSLIRRLFSWFLSFTRTTRRLLRQQTSGHHPLVTSGDSGRLLVRTTQHMRALHALSLSSDHWQDRQTEQFSLWLLFFSTRGKHHADWTRTHRHTVRQLWCDDRRTPPSTSGFVFSTLQSLQRSTLFSKAYLKLLAFRQCHLTTQASPELRTLLPILQLSAAKLSRLTDDRQIKVPLSLSRPS